MIAIDAYKTQWDKLSDAETTSLLSMIVQQTNELEDLPNSVYAFNAVTNYKPVHVFQQQFREFLGRGGGLAQHSSNPERTRRSMFAVAAKVSAMMKPEQQDDKPREPRLRRDDMPRIIAGAVVNGYRLSDIKLHTGSPKPSNRTFFNSAYVLEHLPTGEIVSVLLHPDHRHAVEAPRSYGSGSDYRHLPGAMASRKEYNEYRARHFK